MIIVERITLSILQQSGAFLGLKERVFIYVKDQIIEIREAIIKK